jgi:hypothetical protein
MRSALCSGNDLAGRLAGDLSSRGVRALLLRGPEPAGSPSTRPLDEPPGLEILVQSVDAGRARGVLEELDWNYQLGGPRMWRVHPVATYSWAEAPYLWRQAPAVELSWGVVAAPLPLREFRDLELRLWRGAADDPSGWVLPDAESLAVYLALQAARGGPRREERLRHLADCLGDRAAAPILPTTTRSRGWPGSRALSSARAPIPAG